MKLRLIGTKRILCVNAKVRFVTLLLISISLASSLLLYAREMDSATAAEKSSPLALKISAAPPRFESGQILGSNFGSERGRLYLHLRVKKSAQRSIYAPNGQSGPGRLLGGLDFTNYAPLPGKIIQGWANDSILLKFSADYLQPLVNTVDDVAASRRQHAPLPADIEIGYQIVTADGARSQWFYPERALRGQCSGD